MENGKTVSICGQCMIGALLAACAHVYPTNQTSQAFPSVIARDWPSTVDPAVLREIVENDGFEKRRFRLQVKWSGGDGADISAYVNVNGADEKKMTRVGSGSYLWVYDDEPAQCVPEYRYWFRASYGNAHETVGSATAPLVASVSGWGSVVWHQVGSAVSTTHGHVTVGDLHEARIFVENFTPGRVVFLKLAAHADPDCAKFTLLDMPPLPFSMAACGSVPFRVKWQPQAGDFNDTCQFDVDVVRTVPGTGTAESLLNATITVVGGFGT
jgi:hypothetical protein